MCSRKTFSAIHSVVIAGLLLTGVPLGAQQSASPQQSSQQPAQQPRQPMPSYEPPTRAKTPADAKDKAQPPQKATPGQREPQRQGAEVERQVQDEGVVEKIETELVALDVAVIDQANRPIYNLGKDDFTVYEDKVKQTLEGVSKEEVPLSLGIVIDTSGSMRTKLKTVSDAAAGLIKTLKKEDEAFLAQFKIEPELVRDFTRDKLELEDGLNDLFTGGGTSLLDAVIATADYAHEKGRQRRKALVVISDGLERNSAVKEKEVMQALKEDEVQVYFVGFVDEDDDASSLFGKSPAKKAKELLSRLAEDSGGRAFFPKDLSELPAVTEQIAKDLRTQYVLTYYPTNPNRDNSFRTIRVVVNSKDPNRKLIARTRQGYYARSDRGQPPTKGGGLSKGSSN
jgi:Ca-activated chloride channel homolog